MEGQQNRYAMGRTKNYSAAKSYTYTTRNENSNCNFRKLLRAPHPFPIHLAYFIIHGLGLGTRLSSVRVCILQQCHWIHGGYEFILRTYTEGYPGITSSSAEETRNDRPEVPVLPQKRNRPDEVHPKVLLLHTGNSLRTTESVRTFLESQRIDFSLYRHSVARQPTLTVPLNGREVKRFSLIIMTDMTALFSNWAMRERSPYLSYCRTFNVSLILLTQLATDKLSIGVGKPTALNRLRTRLVYAEAVEYLELNSSHKFYYAKSSERISKVLPNTVWQVFEPIVRQKRDSQTTNGQDHIPGHKSAGQSHITWIYSVQSHVTTNVDNVQGHVTNGPSHVTGMEDSGHHTSRRLLQMVERARVTPARLRRKRDTSKDEVESNFVVLLSMKYFKRGNSSFSTSPVVISVRGMLDGVKKVFIGGPITFWLMKLLLLDMIRSLASSPVLRFGRQRWVMVDIDDAFVAPKGRKMTPNDVQVGYQYFSCLCGHVRYDRKAGGITTCLY